MSNLHLKDQSNSSFKGSDMEMQASDSTIRAQLLESKMIRKKAEEDAQLLANRIALLQLEEKKAMKKIEETKKKAQEIMDLKNRNSQIQREKEELRRQKEEEEIRKTMQNKSTKEQIKMNQDNNRNHLFRRLKDDVDTMRKTKQDVKDFASTTKQQEYSKNAQLVDTIRSREKEAQERKKKQLEETKQKARLEYQSKIEHEHTIKQKTDDLISRLEQQEIELIQRLQNTQSLQKKAFDELEKALA